MTRLQAAIEELRAAMGNRPWLLLFDPCDVTAEDWGFATEHSPHPSYVRLGLIDMAQSAIRYRTLARGKAGTPISMRGEQRHDFDEGGVCRRCWINATLGDADGPCLQPMPAPSAMGSHEWTMPDGTCGRCGRTRTSVAVDGGFCS